MWYSLSFSAWQAAFLHNIKSFRISSTRTGSVSVVAPFSYEMCTKTHTHTYYSRLSKIIWFDVRENTRGGHDFSTNVLANEQIQVKKCVYVSGLGMSENFLVWFNVRNSSVPFSLWSEYTSRRCYIILI